MFRFTIRDVLWLTALVAMGLGWRMDRSALWRKWAMLEYHESTLRHHLEERGTFVRYVDTSKEHSVAIGVPKGEAGQVGWSPR